MGEDQGPIPDLGQAKEDHGAQRNGSASSRLQVKFTQLFQQKSHKPPPEILSQVLLFGAKTLNCDEEGQIAQVKDRTLIQLKPFRNESLA